MSQKKFVVKAPLRSQNSMDREKAKGVWAILSKSIDEIYNKNSSTLSFEEIYRNAYNLVLYKHGEMLYSNVEEKIRLHLMQVGLRLSSSPSDSLLADIAHEWNEHKIVMLMIKDVLMYLDRTFIVQTKKLNVFDLSLKVFKETIIYSPNIRERLKEILLENITKERQGSLIDRGELRTILQMLVSLGIGTIDVYEEEFETPFLQKSKEFYRQETCDTLNNFTCSEYLLRAEQRLNEEMQRVNHYLSPSTGHKLRYLCEVEWIANHATALVKELEETGAMFMIREQRLEDLKRLYSLLSRVPMTLDLFRDCLAQSIRESGEIILEQQKTNKDPLLFVQQFLSLKLKFDVILTQCIREDKKASKRMKDAFESVLNKDNRAASYLASYLDELLKNGGKEPTPSSSSSSLSSSSSSLSLTSPTSSPFSSSSSLGVSSLMSFEMDFESQLERLMVIFRYIHDKDVFELFYKTLLSKRLLSSINSSSSSSSGGVGGGGGVLSSPSTSKSFSEDWERLVLTRLKSECGYQFTSKMEGMFNDMQLTRIFSQEFLQSSIYQSMTIKIEPLILTLGFWPLEMIPTCSLPLVVSDSQRTFSEHFSSVHSGRKLTWMTHLGTGEIKANFPLGKRELTVSTYQMSILMLFNSRSSLSLIEIRSSLSLPLSKERELRQHLLSLCTPKYRILKKSSSGKGIEDSEVFTYNEEFNSKLKKIRIPLVSMKEISSSSSSSSTSSSSSSSSLSRSIGSGGGLESKEMNPNERGGGGGGGGGEMDNMEDLLSLGKLPSSIIEDRNNLMDASIVRIMKARKRLSHNDLLLEVSRQLSTRFQVEPLVVKKRIESLIEREYLERDSADIKTYHYVA